MKAGITTPKESHYIQTYVILFTTVTAQTNLVTVNRTRKMWTLLTLSHVCKMCQLVEETFPLSISVLIPLSLRALSPSLYVNPVIWEALTHYSLSPVTITLQGRRLVISWHVIVTQHIKGQTTLLLLSNTGQEVCFDVSVVWTDLSWKMIDFNLLLTCQLAFLSCPSYFLMCVQVCVCLLIVYSGCH